MDDDPIFKQKYIKYKFRVKIWEKEFKRKHFRIPSKHDIREASKDIRDAYKMYYKLKTSFLEDTLSDVLSEDGFDVLEMSQVESEDFNLDGNIEGAPQLPLDIASIVAAKSESSAPAHFNAEHSFSNLKELPTPSALSNIVNLNEDHVIKKFEAAKELKLNENAWGSSVSKQLKDDSTIKGMEKKSFKTSLSQKLFSNVSFSKRNPRKSLSRSISNVSKRGDLSAQSSSNDVLASREVLPDLETILIQKAKEQQAAAAIAANTLLLAGEKTKDSFKTHLDEGWLNRRAEQDGIKQELIVTPSRKNAETFEKQNTSRRQTYGLSNIDVSKIMSNTAAKSPNKKSSISFKTIRKHSTENSEEEDFSKLKKEHNAVDASDSDSVVCDSEGEGETEEYRHIAKRRRIVNTEVSSIKDDITKVPDNATHNSETKETLKQPTEKQQHNESNTSNSNDAVQVYNFVEGEDFSADDDKDKDYVLDEPKGKRKKAAAKRAKAATTKKLPLPKEKKIPSTKTTKKDKGICRKSTRTKKLKKSTATGNNEQQQPEQEIEAEEMPLNAEDLKYALALEHGDITSIPRVKLSDLDLADDVAQRYINNTATIALPITTTLNTKPKTINERSEAARKKLQEKIASGKLNENFVTINIQKKKFSRGKVPFSYSKHKKKVWKNKKRVAALTGPDMDMGGCDGGVFKCFTCGQTGHFAQQCKVKGDVLLPLSAQLEEDPSPFPTLEEAELQAAQSAVAVHSRNIAKLPQAANVAIYREEKHKSDNDEGSTDADSQNGNNGNDEEEHFFDTDDELDKIDLDVAVANAANAKEDEKVSPIKKYVGHKIPEDFLKKAGLDVNDTAMPATQFGGVGAMYDLNADGSVKDVTPEVQEALHMFGHTNFRKGQDRAVMRILSGLSTLVTLSTGSGKSLCYQLPAYLYSRQKKSITLVISPLVSLMEDQVTGVPHFLRAHCLHTNQTPQQRAKILQMIRDGEIDILLVSPEAVVAGERSTGFGSILRQLPPIAFACIDEAHCVSQWSHNFRPSYLMICKVLRKNLGVKTVLGLTATATLPTRLSIINHLGITDGERGIISDIPLPDNLLLSVSKDENKDKGLLELLNSKRFEACQSIIIYCTRRDECERIAGFLRTCMQDKKANVPDDGKKKRKRVNWHAEPYHAGMPSSRRRTIQNAFMNNELRIVVATIAFGMGINKPDIRAVLHYNMPRNFESYVQEIGRAGRDGCESHCHLFLDSRGVDQNELRRHIYANSIDRHVIRKLLQHIFVPCSCDKNLKDSNYITRTKDDTKTVSDLNIDASNFDSNKMEHERKCPGHEIGFSIEQTVEELDIPAENISTLLCYLELDARWNINVLSSAYIMAKVFSYGGPKYLKHAAKECPPLAMAIALEIKKNKFTENSNVIEFSVIDIAAAIGWNSGVVKFQLKNLEWVQVNGYSQRSPISVSFFDLGFRIKAPGDFTSEEIDTALDTLYERAVKQEHTQLIQLQYVSQGLSSVAYNTYVPCMSEHFSHDRSDQLKGIIRDYFQNDYPKDLKLEINTTSVTDDYIINDVHALINMYPENNFSGRNIARIFHGISSPNYPAVMWGRCKYWRANSNIDFNRTVQLANTVIVKRRI